jgi:hypothetical protein
LDPQPTVATVMLNKATKRAAVLMDRFMIPLPPKSARRVQITARLELQLELQQKEVSARGVPE